MVSHKMFDWTNYSNLTRLQINVDTILFSNRQFDSIFDNWPDQGKGVDNLIWFQNNCYIYVLIFYIKMYNI